jgi:hypothetical protein
MMSMLKKNSASDPGVTQEILFDNYCFIEKKFLSAKKNENSIRLVSTGFQR